MMEKIQKCLFILLIIFLPSQAGLHFWPAWSLVNGVRLDYFAPTVYLTDILILFLFLLEVFNLKFSIINEFSINKFFKFRPSVYLVTGLLALLILLNVTSSLSPAVTVYKWIKVAEFGLLVWWIANNYQLTVPSYKFILIPVFYESFLAIWQFWAQSSIGGWWYFLGERTFSSSTLGIANAYINGALLLRPFGTFPHPNLLGGFLAVLLPVIIWYLPHISRRFNAIVKWLAFGAVSLGMAALFITLSRAAIIVGLGGILAVLGLKFKWKNRAILMVLALVGFVVMMPRLGSLLVEKEAINLRGQFNSRAVFEFRQSPVFGTGLGTSPIYNLQFSIFNSRITNYALVYQPVHNIFLLMASETGLVGLFGFIFIVVAAYRRSGVVLRISLFSILLLGLFDHYFLTLQQGQLLLAGVMALAFGMRKLQVE